MRVRLPELRARHRRFLLGLTLGFAASAAVATATSLGYFSGYQGKALDLYFWSQADARARLGDGQVLPSLSLRLLASLGGLDPAEVARTLAGPDPVDLSLPEWDEARSTLRQASPLRFFRDDDWKINFIGPAGSFLTIGSDAVYQLGVSDQEVARENPLRDRIVLVGATFGESRDAFPTPRGWRD